MKAMGPFALPSAWVAVAVSNSQRTQPEKQQQLLARLQRQQNQQKNYNISGPRDLVCFPLRRAGYDLGSSCWKDPKSTTHLSSSISWGYEKYQSQMENMLYCSSKLSQALES